jgi:16S rRNA A1518/A1519 N6-dimethyltransferase RsmA/KsgA/DIM1 with predicted DNA glycosylase/AP lyase activity
MSIEEDPEGHEVAALEAVVSFASCRVVEIGCGDGRLTRRYASVARSVTAIDPDADAVAEVIRHLPMVDARAVGVDSLVLAPQTIDVVLFAWSLC